MKIFSVFILLVSLNLFAHDPHQYFSVIEGTFEGKTFVPVEFIINGTSEKIANGDPSIIAWAHGNSIQTVAKYGENTSLWVESDGSIAAFFIADNLGYQADRNFKFDRYDFFLLDDGYRLRSHSTFELGASGIGCHLIITVDYVKTNTGAKVNTIEDWVCENNQSGKANISLIFKVL